MDDSEIAEEVDQYIKLKKGDRTLPDDYSWLKQTDTRLWKLTTVDERIPGDLGHEDIGQEYIDAIRRRSEANAKRREIESEWNLPSDIENRKRVRFEMTARDTEWQNAVLQARGARNEIADIYRRFLSEHQADFEYKKDKIEMLISTFPYARSNEEVVAAAAEASVSYTRGFEINAHGRIRDRDPTTSQRKRIYDRDEHGCVRCGSSDTLEIHHIIPFGVGGDTEMGNLALLCGDCHAEAHIGTSNRVVYDSVSEFWDEWV